MPKITVIAEAGVNHNGRLNLALKMVDLAAKSGADYIKFQTFNPGLLSQKNLGLVDYQKQNYSKNSQLKMLQKLSLSHNDFIKILKRCKQKKIKFLSSPFDIESINFLKKLKLKTIKVPSGEINNIPYLRELGKLTKNIILSTGMSNIVEIKKAIKELTDNGTKKNRIVIMHCSTEYPADVKKLNLKSIKFLKDKLKMEVGYSDHSLGFEASIMSITLGAKIFEKHFTLNKKFKGPDHKASLSPKELIEYVDKLKLFSKSVGEYNKKPYRKEVINSKFIRKQIVALKKIKKGEKFNLKNITTKRAKKGISASKWDQVVGKVSKFNFLIDENIKI